MFRLTTRPTRSDTLFPDTTLFRATCVMLADYGSSRYRVYDKKGISPSVVTPIGGLSQPKFQEGNKIRKLTPLECERLMGFPDNRSKEHTSELQTLMRISYAVFCLNKKNITIE